MNPPFADAMNRFQCCAFFFTEKKLREKAELQIKALEKDMASIKSGSLLASGADAETEMLR